MSVMSALQRMLSGSLVVSQGSAYPIREHVDFRIEPRELPYRTMYGLLKLMYSSTGAYDDLRRARVIIGGELPMMKSIRNPVSTVTRLWGSKLYPKPLDIVTDNERIVDPIKQVHKWSNWKAKSVTTARWTALYGESFVKVCADAELGRVWFEYFEPCYVTKYVEDSRGFIQWIRLDIPKYDDDDHGGTADVYGTTPAAQVRADGSQPALKTYTEVWSGVDQTYTCWETNGDDGCLKSIKDLGTPKESVALSAFGYDFVPFVRTPFSDMGGERAEGAVQLALEPIWEADLSATNLHSMIYQDAEGAWVATAAGVDRDGRPLPAMRVTPATTRTDPFTGRTVENGAGESADKMILGKRSFWRLQSGYDLKSVVPDIDYDAALSVLKDHDETLEKLMPALLYVRVSQLSNSDLSGRAIRYLLSPFIDQVLEIREVALDKLAQQDMMALTLGQVNGITGFGTGEIGTYDAGDFEHTFKHQDVVPLSSLERAEEGRTIGQALQAYDTAGYPLAAALEDLGYPEERIEEIVKLAEKKAEEAAKQQQELFEQQGGTTDEEDEEEEEG